MKPKALIIASLVFFILVNTSDYWESSLGLLAFPAFLILVAVFITLAIGLVFQLIKLTKKSHRTRIRFLALIVTAIVLLLAFMYPNGIVSVEQLRGDNLLVAEREGAANCMTTFKLRPNNEFPETNICFGVTKITGKYEQRGDTLILQDIDLGRHEDEYFEYAVIKNYKVDTANGKIMGELVRYESALDTVGVELWITMNNL